MRQDTPSKADLEATLPLDRLVLKVSDLNASHARYLNQQHNPRLTLRRFTEALLEAGTLREIQLKSMERTAIRYLRGEPEAEEIGLSLCIRHEDAYLSHGTAATLHELLRAPLDCVYVNEEQRQTSPEQGLLSQVTIDRAFARPARRSSRVFTDGLRSFCLLAGKNTGRLGVTALEHRGRELQATDIPRTLIDIAVRPQYCGGVATVAEAYRAARDRTSVETLAETLARIHHVYPYHQTVGFYLSRAGYAADELGILRAGISFDFYLTNQINDRAYDGQWRIYYPASEFP